MDGRGEDGGAGQGAAVPCPRSALEKQSATGAWTEPSDWPNLERFAKLMRGTWVKHARVMAIALGIGVSILPAQQGRSQSKRPGDDGPAVNAPIDAPSHLALDSHGNIFVYESLGGAIRRIDNSTKKITTVALECNPPWQKPVPPDCFGPISRLQVTDSGKLLFSEFTYNRLSSYDLATHLYSVIAGNGGLAATGDGGPAKDAGITVPHCLATAYTGDIFVCDSSHFIRRIETKTGIISRVAGDGKRGYSGDGGPAINAEFVTPLSIAVDHEGNIFVADDTSNRIRRVDVKTGIIETYAGIGAVPPARVPRFSGEGGPAVVAGIPSPRSLVLDPDGNLVFLTDGRVCRIDRLTGILSTIAGTGREGYSGDRGLATAAQIGPVDLASDNEGNLFIAEFGNNRIRRIDAKTGIITTVAGNGLPHRPPTPIL
jgi:sugar lactone lactonase YvrE